MFGRRGEVVWKKQPFVGGGGRRDYDAYLGWGFVAPFYLTVPIHTFGWGEEGDLARAIPLEKDSAFARRVYLTHWLIVLLILSGVGVLPLCGLKAKLAVVLVFLVLGVMALSMIGLVILHFTKGSDSDIRLVLGKHRWGSSDPATWDRKLLKKVVDPQKAFQVESFGKLSKVLFKEKRYAEAMWAARLCLALEDEDEGQELTQQLLDHSPVRKKLAKVRRSPEKWSDSFGDSIDLASWVKGDLDGPILTVSGRTINPVVE